MKNNTHLYKFYSILIISLVIILTVLIIYFEKFSSILGNNLLSIVVAIIYPGIAIPFLVLIIFRHVLRTPASLTLSLLGQPQSGKTVYLTVLFRELLVKGELPGFSIYGAETVERVQSDYKQLEDSQWLPSTDMMGSNVFFYRATVNYDNIIPKPKYKLEISDYAGEFLEKELLENEGYFHRTKYFKYVIDSDIIFPTIDLEKYATEERKYIIEIEKTLIAALDIIKQSKINKGKCKVPIGILFLKSDKLNTMRESTEEITQGFNNLINYVNKHFLSYKIFFVSAISPRLLEVDWGKNISPENVVQPVEWALQVVRR